MTEALSECSGADLLVEQLIAEGIRTVFALPGIQLDFAIDALARRASQIEVITPRHEQAAAYMADGAARSTGRPAAFLVVPGPGMLNSLAGLATAFACSSPVLALIGQIDTRAMGRGFGVLHEIPDQSGILRSLSKWWGMARDPRDAPSLVAQACLALRSGRPRPAVLELPPDMLEGRVADPGPVTAPPVGEPELDEIAIRQAAGLLTGAERPVLYCGWGVQASDASEAVAALSRRLGAPVVTSHHGRGTLSDRDQATLTSLAGRSVLRDADVVVAIGTRFLDGLGRPVAASQARLILLNADAADLGEPRQATVVIRADAREGATALLEQLPPDDRPFPHEVVARGRRQAVDELERYAPLQWSYIQALRAGIPDDGILVSDLTQVGYVADIAYPAFGPRTYLTPGYQGTLGYGFPTALGVKAVNPDRMVVSISGDGGFGWALQELATARKYGIGTVTVVFNDGAFGNVRRIQKQRFGERYLGTDLVNPDYRDLAKAFSVDFSFARSPEELTSVITAAKGIDQPLLVEVPQGELPSPWHLIHDFVPAPAPAQD